VKGINSYEQRQKVKAWMAENGHSRLTQKVVDLYIAEHGPFPQPRVFGRRGEPILKIGAHSVGRGLWPQRDVDGNTYYVSIEIETRYGDGTIRSLSFSHDTARAIGEALIALASEPDPLIEVRKELGLVADGDL
jgi:hypothetical protein